MRNRILKVLAPALAALLLSGICAQAAPSYVFRHYTTGDGLASNTVRAVVQDGIGLMWVGTSDGLFSFDGREFLPHPFTEATEDTYINYLFEDSLGRLWVCTDDGAYVKDGEPALNLGCIVDSVAEDKDGNVWLATRGRSIIRVDSAGQPHEYAGLCSEISCVFVDSMNIVWVCNSAGPALMTYNRASDSFQEAGISFSDCKAERIGAIAEDSSSNLWLGTWSGKLLHLDRNSQTVTGKVEGINGLRHVHTMIESSAGEILCGSDDGLFWYNAVTDDTRLFVNDRNDTSSISDKFVYSIIRDAEGGIWAGTWFGGLNYCAPGGEQFVRKAMSDLAGGGENCIVSCFCEDDDGTVWAGSDNGGLVHYSPSADACLERFTPWANRNKLSSNNIHALCKDGDTLWIGTYSGGVNRLDTKTGKIRYYLDGDSVYALFRDFSGQVWAATMSGILEYLPETDSFETRYETGCTTLDIDQGPDGALWFATIGRGILRHDPKSGVWQNFSTADGLPSNNVNSLCFNAEGRLWAATRKGVCFWQPGGEKFHLTDLGEPLNALFITYDGHQLWISTNRGLLRHSPAIGRTEKYNDELGLTNQEFTPNCGLLSRDGRIHIGTTRDFVSFYPHGVYENKYTPTVLITRFMVRESGRSATEGGGDWTFYNTWDKQRLHHRDNNIRLSYTALSYCSPGKNRYSYMLEGFDRRWRDAGSETRVEYTNLPAGHYRFHVRAANNDGVWNNTGASLEFTIKPHPLLSAPAMAVYCLLALLGLAALIRFLRKKTEEKSQMKFEEYVKEFEAEERTRQSTAFAEKLNRLIEENIANVDLSADMLATELCVSRSGLFTKVKEATGKTPHQLILEARLRKATEMLSEGKASINEISYSVGFNTPSYFTKCFTKEFGVAPKDWAKKK